LIGGMSWDEKKVVSCSGEGKNPIKELVNREAEVDESCRERDE